MGNIGSFAVPISMCLQSINSSSPGSVIAVEALPRHVDMLRANLRVNFIANALVLPYAVGKTSKGFHSMYTDSKNKCHSSLVGNFEGSYGGNSTRKSRVRVTTLDDVYFSQQAVMRRVLVMKIDVEGYEGHALFGASNFLTESPPC